MARKKADLPPVNVLIVGQSGRLQYEALLFAASLRHSGTSDRFRLFIAEPQPGPLWRTDPRIADPGIRDALSDLGATFLPFESRHFGQDYAYGNKIEALTALPRDEPFVFFDTDTLVLDALDTVPFDFDRPTASLRREGTWPQLDLYGPGYTQTWKSLYDTFGLDFDSSLDLTQPDEYWRRYLYFNAGFFFYRCPHAFGQRFLDYALAIRDDAPPELVCQSLDPWLDQVALPLGHPARRLPRRVGHLPLPAAAAPLRARGCPRRGGAGKGDRTQQAQEALQAVRAVQTDDLSGARAQGAGAFRPGRPARARTGDPQPDQAGRLLDALTGAAARVSPGGDRPLCSLAYSPDSTASRWTTPTCTGI